MGPERENAVFDILKMMAGMLTNLCERIDSLEVRGSEPADG